MDRTWAALPASPCSSTSDEAEGPAVLHKTLPSKPSTLSDLAPPPVSAPSPPQPRDDSTSQPLSKRARVEIPCVEFAQPQNAPMHGSLPHDLLNRLNSAGGRAPTSSDSPRPDRRQHLLERLKTIKSQKAEMFRDKKQSDNAGTPVMSEVKTGSDDDVTFVGETNGTLTTDTAQPQRKERNDDGNDSGTPGVIVVEDDTSTQTRQNRKRKAGRKSDANDLASAAKRTSTRVRRLRNVEESSTYADRKKRAMPPCMSKCRRLQFCKKLLNGMLRDPSAAPFSAPVNELWHKSSIPRYYEIISRPMDLRTVKRNLETSLYFKPVEHDMLPFRFDVDCFADDVRLVFRNAMIYNRPGDALHSSARTLYNDFEKTLVSGLPCLPVQAANSGAARLKKKSNLGGSRKRKGAEGSKTARNVRIIDDDDMSVGSMQRRRPPSKKGKGRKSISETLSSDTELEGMTIVEMKERLHYLRRCRTPVLARTPVPKGAGYLSRAALLYDVEMTFDEREKCARFLQEKVPVDKTEALIDLIKKSEGLEAGNSTEGFEVDVDNVGNQTMRNIEAFLEEYVAGFKSIRSSTLGREFSRVEEVDLCIANVQRHIEKATEIAKGEKAILQKRASFFEDGGGEESSSDSSSSSGSGSDSSDESDSDSE